MIRVMPGTLKGREHHSCRHSLEAHISRWGGGLIMTESRGV